jgi:dienelactone hydrolase
MLKSFRAALACIAAFSGALATQAGAAPETTSIYKVPYSHDTTALEGRWVLPIPAKPQLPIVVLFPDWMGVSKNATDDAQRIASWGYAVFLADPYGLNLQPKSQEEAGMRAGALKQNIPLVRARARAALEAAKRQTGADTARVVAIGYCFGGILALELARSGAPLRGTVNIHGNLKTETPGDARSINGPVLALRGADDPFVPWEEAAMFRDEMKAAGVDWQLVEYGGAVHAFTNPKAGNDPSKGAAYNPVATARANAALKAFFEETLRSDKKAGKKKRR